jgi:hypothetical protein
VRWVGLAGALIACLALEVTARVWASSSPTRYAQAEFNTAPVPENASATQGANALGESIYLHGITQSGSELAGARGGALPVTTGVDAACVNCHRHSGLGTNDERIRVPPITGRYLFHPQEASAGDPDLHYVGAVLGDRAPYTDATLARAVREGINSEGKPLGTLMPRFHLNDTEMQALVTYLRSMDRSTEPGVSDTVLHFATIVTPDADPQKRGAMLSVLQQYFKDKNLFPFPPSPRMHTSAKTVYAKSMYMANRRWQLHVWDLSGPPSTWRAQLEERIAKEPVMAVVSGLGAGQWEPVHEFCEQQHVPCLFPNVEVPLVEERDFYSLYFSKGVLLEAGLLANAIEESGAGRAHRTVLQIYRDGDSGESAARALGQNLQRRGIAVRNHMLTSVDSEGEFARALEGASSADSLVLWLRPSDIARLASIPPPGVPVYVSGVLGGLEHMPLPASWRVQAHLSYPFDLPDRRLIRVDYPLGWFSLRHIPVVDEQVQVDTYLACGLLAEALSHSADTFNREYLVERTEDLLEHRVLTGYYPRLTLAEGQRFASKGGYVVHFKGAEGSAIVADQDWTVP